jgi:hypothetical protein
LVTAGMTREPRIRPLETADVERPVFRGPDRAGAPGFFVFSVSTLT